MIEYFICILINNFFKKKILAINYLMPSKFKSYRISQVRGGGTISVNSHDLQTTKKKGKKSLPIIFRC